MSSLADVKAIETEAWRLHHEEGHPPHYAGPCWGPTPENIEQAKANIKAGSGYTGRPTETGVTHEQSW